MRSVFTPKACSFFVEVFQRGFVQHLEGEEVDARLVSLAQHHAVVVAFGAGLEIGTALGIAALWAPGSMTSVYHSDRFLQIEHANLCVAGAQNTCHCHESSPFTLVHGLGKEAATVRQTFFSLH